MNEDIYPSWEALVALGFEKKSMKPMFYFKLRDVFVKASQEPILFSRALSYYSVYRTWKVIF